MSATRTPRAIKALRSCDGVGRRTTPWSRRGTSDRGQATSYPAPQRPRRFSASLSRGPPHQLAHLGHRRADLVGFAGDLVREGVDAAMTQHSGEVVLDAVERELHRVTHRELINADDRVRAARMVDVVVVRFVFEAVEPEVLEAVSGAADMECGAVVIERHAMLDGAAVRLVDDVVGQPARFDDELHGPGVDRDGVRFDHGNGHLFESDAPAVGGVLTVDRHGARSCSITEDPGNAGSAQCRMTSAGWSMRSLAFTRVGSTTRPVVAFAEMTLGEDPVPLVPRTEPTFLPEPEPRALWCPIVSVDDHVVEPPDLFEARVPRSMLASAPALVEDEHGIPFWIVDGLAYPYATSNGSAGRPVAEWVHMPQKYEDFRRGVYDPSARLGDMDLNGVWASLCFPSFVWGFAGRRFSAMRDGRLGLACLRAYNHWMRDEWCASDEDRFIPCQIPWLADPSVGAEEIRANAQRG